MPRGQGEEGESIRAAAVRETKEKCGLTLLSSVFLLFTVS
ncbi:NUDIX domain-containing protein [Halobacillus sp. B23F22_1]